MRRKKERHEVTSSSMEISWKNEKKTFFSCESAPGYCKLRKKQEESLVIFESIACFLRRIPTPKKAIWAKILRVVLENNSQNASEQNCRQKSRRDFKEQQKRARSQMEDRRSSPCKCKRLVLHNFLLRRCPICISYSVIQPSNINVASTNRECVM